MSSIRKINPGEVSVGESLPWPVYDIEKALLLKEGTVVRSEKQLQIILEKGVYRGLSEEEVVEEKEQEEKEKSRHVKTASPFHMKRLCAQELQQLSQKLITGKAVDVQESVSFVTNRIKEDCYNNANATLAAIHLSGEFSYSVLHPLHTAILCELLMRRLSFSDEQQQTVMAAALLMNLGMYELQDELFSQVEPLTETQKLAVHEHPERSVLLLKKAGVNDANMLSIILQHHERIDGEGYPAKLTGDKIHQGAKVVALADMYAAMITPRSYREPIMAQTALKQIFTDRGKSVDDHLTQLLIREVGVYPPGSFVKLANGDTAIVIKRAIVKKGRNATAPVVACIISPRGGVYEKPSLRDSNLDMYKITSMATPEFEKPIDFSTLWGY
ncbi:MAG: hypothetical protein A6F70_07620 [Cycloclasticus sp. symbiont of Bathymodiolus heckerae]|nr:MAG: hypothetical protein A6F70_07620 [Cycloclasticus sp. symbiont of Bathymodiolus heckerae]